MILMNAVFKIGGLLALALCLSLPLAAQRPGRTPVTTPTTTTPTTTTPTTTSGDPNQRQQQQQQNQQALYNDVDTFGVFAFYAENPQEERPFKDSLLNDYYQQFDPVRRRDFDWIHLGLVGSAAQPIVFQPVLRQGFDIGLHQYDLYVTPVQRLPFYRLEKAYTNLSFTQGSAQPDGILLAQFSRNFAKGINYTLDYQRISQLSQQTQFINQSNQHTTFSNGLSYKGPNGRYEGYFAYAANTINHEDNGGLITEPAQGGDFSSPSSADVYLDDARTRHTHREIAYTHFYRVGGGVDSLGHTRRAYTLNHQFIYGSHKYKYYDDFAQSDTFFYKRFPVLLNDDRGIRFYLEDRVIENSFKISTFKLDRKGSGKGNAAKRQRDVLEVGLRHARHQVSQEPVDTVLNNLFLEGRIGFQPNDRINVQGEAHLGLLWANAGDYRLSGQLQWNTGKIGALSVQFTNQLASPAWLQSSYYLTQEPLWQNDFKKTLSTHLWATYALPKWRIRVSGGYHLLNNYIYYDTTALPRQISAPISIVQLALIKNFKLGPIYLDNVAALQKSSEEDALRLPQLFAKHSLYYQGRWFKVLEVRFGADLRYSTNYYANYYNPVTGQFQLQNDREVALYPALDAFFCMRVTRFRAFIKWENFTSLFIKDRLFYQTAYYGHPTAAIRWGISWRLVN